MAQETVEVPITGKIISVNVKKGDTVKVGQSLAIIEAMKMENELKAKDDGRVKQVKVKSGQAVDKDEVLIVFE